MARGRKSRAPRIATSPPFDKVGQKSGPPDICPYNARSRMDRDPVTAIRSSPKESTLRKIFLDLHGVRSGWKVLLYYVVLVSLVASLVLAVRMIRAWLGMPRAVTGVLTPGRAIVNEVVILCGVLLTTAIFARWEKRDFADYGIPRRGRSAARFLEGAVWGVAMMSCVLLILRTTGNFSFGPVGLAPQQIAVFALVWAVLFAMVGFAESFAFSGYSLATLARGMGFWPAAAVLGVLFGCLHLVTNAGENWLGSLSLVIVGLLVAFTIKRTGSLWFAIGMHGAWDWAQSFLYGVPDSGIVVSGHLLNPTFQGSKWMTGGSAGPEGSVVTLLGYGFAFLLIHLRFPQRGSVDTSA